MKILDRFNRFAGKWMPLLTPACLLLGVLFPNFTGMGIPLVPYVFAVMTFIGALSSIFRDVKNVFRHPGALLLTMAVLHVALPLMSLGMGKLFFSSNPNLITGMVLEFVVPSAVVAVMWTTMGEGNVPLALSVLVVDTFVTPFLLPLTLNLLLGSGGQMDAGAMIRQLIFMVALPALAAMTLNFATHNRTKETLPKKLAPFSKLAVMFVVASNSSKVAPYVRNFTWQLLAVTAAIFVLAAAGYALGWLAGRVSRQNSGTIAAMTFGAGMRNISAGAVLAAAYFPAEVMFPVMIGTLFQQILAACYSALLKKFQPRETAAQEGAQSA
ncbi:MAG: bile acid:sodium symporter family protein [Oscillospiraceae bacterium]|nr:bile acid:sodium symporter family protein [Oscillospiraceae bacterium]